ncbi:MAG: hypothetical protein IPK82_39170 [Polyangiaceae bacterium]|nr:hypothetical protein [Polyangiaceae bacterium]
MMVAWSFSAKTLDELGRLLRSLGKHRYVEEVDHRIHWMIDEVLSDRPMFAPHAAAFQTRRKKDTQLDPSSRDPTLWRTAPLDEVLAALAAFWVDDGAHERREALRVLIEKAGLPIPTHAPFEAPPEEPPHPELIQLDWVLLPVDELDTDRHRGALEAMEEWAEEVPNPSAPIYQEGPSLAFPELCAGMHDGQLAAEWIVWSEPPFSYADYVLRGASKAARLDEPPVGYHDL